VVQEREKKDFAANYEHLRKDSHGPQTPDRDNKILPKSPQSRSREPGGKWRWRVRACAQARSARVSPAMQTIILIFLTDMTRDPTSVSLKCSGPGATKAGCAGSSGTVGQT
jgi:hypothetical protein